LRRTDRGQELHDRRRGRCARTEWLVTVRGLSRREASRTPILYAFDPIEHDGKDLRDFPFLKRKAALEGLLPNTEAGIILSERVAEDPLLSSLMSAGLVPRASSASG
jgi:hypothetical protein